MAPEQFGGAKTADALCDVYSLGATLYNAVTGRLPFHAKFPLAILARKEKEKLSVRAVVPELSARIDTAIQAALQPNANDRPASCLEFFKLLTSRSFEGESADVMAAFQSQQAAGPDDRRACVRHPLEVGTCGVVNTSACDDGGPESEEMWPLVIRDVSAGGIGVVLARRFEPGTELIIECVGGSAASVYRIRTRVVRVESGGAGHWIHGCAFHNKLSDSQLGNLIKFA